MVVLIALAGGYYFVKKYTEDGEEYLEQIEEDAFEAFRLAGATISTEISEGFATLGNSLRGLGSDIGTATLDVLENAGIALMKGSSKTANYFVEEIGDRKVSFVKQMTILIIVLMTTVYVYNLVMMKDR